MVSQPSRRRQRRAGVHLAAQIARPEWTERTVTEVTEQLP
jgi:hypothetical protein